MFAITILFFKQALNLGCIVIVKTSALDPMYDGLPVRIAQSCAWLPQGAETMRIILHKKHIHVCACVCVQVWIVKDWKEVTGDNMQKVLDDFRGRSFQLER